MTKLQEVSALAAAYLESFDPILYTEAFILCRRFGHDSSNVAE